MQKHRRTGWAGAALLGLCCAVLGAAPASALDFNDVQNLIRNQVPENVIINMTQQDSSLVITPEQANQLRGMGASESLIAAIRPAASTQAAVPSSASDYMYPADGGYQASVPAQPSVSYGYDSSGNIVYFDQNTGQVQSTVPQPSVSYASPGVTYYDPSTPIIIDSSPTVIYETPTIVTSPSYVYSHEPSWGFSIGFGSGYNRWHGGPPRYRPGNRPPPIYRPGGPGRPGRPGGPGGPGGRPGGRPPRPRP